MLSVTNEPLMLSVIVLNAVMLNVVMLNVVAPDFSQTEHCTKILDKDGSCRQ